MTRDEVLTLIRDHLADELSADPAAITETDPLPGGPVGGLAGPLLARAGARGHLRPEDVRRGRGAHPHRRPGRGLRPGPRPFGTLSAAQAPRHARAAAGRPRPAGGHAFFVDGEALGLLRAARVPGRFGARPRDHDAPLSAAAAGRLRGRPADEGPRAGGLRPFLPRRGGAPGHPGAAAQRGAAGVRRAGDGAARAHGAGAGVGDRGRDRGLLPGVRLRAGGGRGGGGLPAGDRAGARASGGLQVARCRSAWRGAARS